MVRRHDRETLGANSSVAERLNATLEDAWWVFKWIEFWRDLGAAHARAVARQRQLERLGPLIAPGVDDLVFPLPLTGGGGRR